LKNIVSGDSFRYLGVVVMSNPDGDRGQFYEDVLGLKHVL